VGNPGRVIYPHNKRANVLYFDFHAGQVGQNELTAQNLYLTQQ
jgi:prepilin-type processing-associated H-X9-DG protein